MLLVVSYAGFRYFIDDICANSVLINEALYYERIIKSPLKVTPGDLRSTELSTSMVIKNRLV